MYTAEEEILNGHNGDVPPQPILPMVEEPKIDVVQSAAVLSGLGEFAPGGPCIFILALQYHWHSVTMSGTDVEAREHLMALKQKVFTFMQQAEEREAELMAQIAQLEVQRGSADEDYRVFRQ